VTGVRWRVASLGRVRLTQTLRHLHEGGMVAMILIAGVIFTAVNPAFASVDNFLAIVSTVALVGIVAVLSTHVVVAGGFDLSVGSNVALSAILVAATVNALSPGLWWIGILAGLGVGGGIGVVNGTLVTRLPVQPFIVTLGTLLIFRGIAQWVGSSYTSTVTRPQAFFFIGGGKIGSIPFQAILFVGIAALFLGIERGTVYGRLVFAAGANAKAARLAGLPVKRIKFATYVVSGLGAGLAGVIQTSQIRVAASYYAQGLELDVLTAILLGGTSMYGGEGSVARSVLGALLVGEVANGLGVLNVNADVQVVIKGSLLIFAVLLDRTLRGVAGRAAQRAGEAESAPRLAAASVGEVD
jgi:ribose/xylose/arabinose/galactoside ABC-type transport system permease subunit